MKNTQIKSALLFILLICLGFAIDFLQSPKAYSGNEDVQICVFDVGQGDSILIASGDEQILVDGGPSSVILEKLEKAMPFWDRKIELIVNTHPHADHVTGLNFVLDRYAVDTVWSSGLQYSTAVYRDFIDLADELVAKKGDSYVFKNGATATVLWPNSNLEGQFLDDVNDGSIVLLVEYGEVSALLTGDIGVEEESVLLANLPDIDVLKVAHQGSSTSTSQAFVDVSKPEISIISVGENDYGHPNKMIIDRLQSAGSIVMRTDLMGDVCVILDKEIARVY